MSTDLNLITEGTVIRAAIVLVSVVCLVLIVITTKWREKSRSQLLHWQAVILLMFAAAYGASEALWLGLPGGSRLLVVLVAVLLLLLSIIVRAKDAQSTDKKEV